jgi:hypothetical protein
MSIDYQYTKVLEERKEVQEDSSIDYCHIATRSVHQEEEEGRSNNFDHSIASSALQEEEEVLLAPTWKDPVFRQHTLECVVMQYP